MADLTPLTSVFTSLNMKLGSGFKITMEHLNKLAANTGFNWRGGKNPMRDAFGVIEITFDDFDTQSVGVNINEALPVIKTIRLSDRQDGVFRFSKKNSYVVFFTIASVSDIRREPNEDFTNILNVEVISQEIDSFEMRLDMPFLGSVVGVDASTTFKIKWFAKGY